MQVTWQQWCALAAVVAVTGEGIYWRLRSLLLMRGSVDAALSVLSGRVEQVAEAQGALSDRLERVEKDLKLR